MVSMLVHMLVTLPVVLALVCPRPNTACKPSAWTCAWPPPASDRCCSTSGFLGSTAPYCGNGGIDPIALGCCQMDSQLNIMTCCDDTAPAPPTGPCTGISAIDTILNAANLPVVTGLWRSKVPLTSRIRHVLLTILMQRCTHGLVSAAQSHL